MADSNKIDKPKTHQTSSEKEFQVRFLIFNDIHLFILPFPNGMLIYIICIRQRILKVARKDFELSTAKITDLQDTMDKRLRKGNKIAERVLAVWQEFERFWDGTML